MAVIFPEDMDRSDTENLTELVRRHDDYIRYMRERIEYIFGSYMDIAKQGLNNAEISNGNGTFSVDGNGYMTAEAGKIGNVEIIDGKLICTYDAGIGYPTSTKNWIRDFIQNPHTPTEQELEMYDLNNDGVINTLDLALASKYESNEGTYKSRLIIDPTTSTVMKIEDTASIGTEFAPDLIRTPTIQLGKNHQWQIRGLSIWNSNVNADGAYHAKTYKGNAVFDSKPDVFVFATDNKGAKFTVSNVTESGYNIKAEGATGLCNYAYIAIQS